MIAALRRLLAPAPLDLVAIVERARVPLPTAAVLDLSDVDVDLSATDLLRATLVYSPPSLGDLDDAARLRDTADPRPARRAPVATWANRSR